ncbi:hypothetical protein SEA_IWOKEUPLIKEDIS_96 [Mycobacterium phage Iwokeuplikedis]|nr:hypothetical protein SEA_IWOKEUPLIKEDIS_96 [Mycobacterium phage Iwokeuplikedis]
MDHIEIAIELRTVAELHKNKGNVAYAKALVNQASACSHGFGNVEDYARILGKAEEAL